jgi:hypothetical protein
VHSQTSLNNSRDLHIFFLFVFGVFSTPSELHLLLFATEKNRKQKKEKAMKRNDNWL